jgi:hypothetical protein
VATLTLRRLAAAGCAVVLCLGSTLLATTPASATNFSGITGLTGCDELNQADNATHNFEYIDLNADNTAATNWVRTNVIDPTVINTSIDSTPDEHTDVNVIDRYYTDYCGYNWYTSSSGGTIGATKCDLLSSTNRCDRHSVRYSNYWTDIASNTGRRWLACHENGHGLGLLHRYENADGCMSPSYVDASTSTVAYSLHDKAHLSSAY